MSVLLGLQESENPLAKVSRSFKEYSQGQGTLAIVVAGVLVLLILGSILYSLMAAQRKSVHWQTFREFAEASGLTPPETKLFIFVAERVQPENPVALFFKRSVFETAMQDLSIDQARANTLRRKVYGP
jgi:hypothetical protein